MFSFCQYRISGINIDQLNYNTWEYADRHELSILIGGKLGSIHNGICFKNHELAEKYLQMNINKWKKKWGHDLNVEIVTVSTNDRKSFFKVLDHTDLVLTRLEKINPAR